MVPGPITIVIAVASLRSATHGQKTKNKEQRTKKTEETKENQRTKKKVCGPWHMDQDHDLI